MRLKSKIVVFSSVIFCAFISIALWGLHALSDASERDNIARINQLMKSTVNIVEQFEQLASTGSLSEEQAKKFASQLLRENKYHDSEYVYVVDEKLDFVAAPHDPQLHGTSFNDFRDASGHSIGEMVEQLVGQKTATIITYHWESQRDGDIVDMTSVVQKTPGWHWYIGTGISYAEADSRYWAVAKWLLTFSLTIAIIITLLLIRFGLNLQGSLGAEIEDVRRFVMRVSRGDLKQENSFVSTNDNSVVGAMNYMQVGLQGVVSAIGEVTNILNSQTHDSEQRSAELDDLTNALSEEAQIVASSITQLTASSASVAELAKQAADSVTAAEKQGLQAHQLTQSSAETISLLENQIDSAGQNIQILDDEVNNIASVLSVIQGIAEQTNLLALNAAIEAARAGDQGRGFAVVADEVRQLAQRTQTSTEQIQLTIVKLQSATQDAKLSVSQSVSTSADTVAKSQDVALALSHIAQSLSAISSMSHQISQAAVEQLTAGEDAATRIATIADTARNTSAVSVQVHAGTDQTQKLIQTLESEITKFSV
ncbi:methyl-accepting chemotaxis protein [Shewanella sp. 1_MG-2023]|uniref:methyl-accepting chemotaxis protein n=1 Tax=unclassified Shewanella TaxID=196818 RepID=UPI001E54DB42|nr:MULTISPECIES: methyl-accepting chemotaxis protein [unclassified Shewanella]MCC4833237.1 methyl-accepting chemotaxis protein [Shewanella sp. 10N.7]MDO6612723.1 methyl-accepting chemotaxis protein [Shewanella sp. 7_MG-2023]MDO6772684.1 methyl-accepting chemotaxis protein [Shewanella sp. 2_MG-2023]MDO6794848.1 methyl-accepting chemotaxis protein [Shewanella sp. 1_MG-2023]